MIVIYNPARAVGSTAVELPRRMVLTVLAEPLHSQSKRRAVLGEFAYPRVPLVHFHAGNVRHMRSDPADSGLPMTDSHM